METKLGIIGEHMRPKEVCMSHVRLIMNPIGFPVLEKRRLEASSIFNIMIRTSKNKML